MQRFALKDAGKTYYCDTDGDVHDSANVIGTWTTEKNKIQIKTQTGGTVTIPVAWRFNDKNQLMIAQGGGDVFTIAHTTNALPRYALIDNVLWVDPDGDRDFSFSLDCIWGMEPNGNIAVSIDGIRSTLDGFIEDNRSRLQFQFYDADLPDYPSALLFSGEWQRVKKQPDGTWRPLGAKEDDSEIRLRFVLKKTTLEDRTAPLVLPASLQVDKKRNHLVLMYDSPNRGTHSIEFAGSMEITRNWTLKFRIADEKNPKVTKQQIEIETTFEWDQGDGTIKLFVGREKRAGATQLEVAGSVHAQLKGGKLEWTFAYKNSTAGGQATVTFATALRFTSEHGEIYVKYMQAGTERTVNVTGKVTTKGADYMGGIEILKDGQKRRVSGFFGVSW